VGGPNVERAGTEESTIDLAGEETKPDPVVLTGDNAPSSDIPTTTSTEPALTSSDPAPAEPTSTGLINTIESAIVETVEQVKEVINAETPAAALTTRESDAVVDDPENSQTEGVEEEKTEVEPVVAEKEDATPTEDSTTAAVETETNISQPEPTVAEEMEPEFEDEDPKYIVHIVSNKYNTKNFWSVPERFLLIFVPR